MITREEEVSWAYLLDPCFQFENTAGKPLTGGYIEVYLHGTRDKYYCASDFNGTLHPFQIKLDSLGANIVLADPSNSYDVYVYNRYGNLVMSRYNVSTGHTGSGAYDRYDELENLIVSAVTALQGEIDDIDEALDGKKDKQEVVSLTFTNTQTVSSIVQNENGELEITYQEIALPEQVPNIDIVSLASTISVSSVYDPETNIKTFNIDISDIGALEYGRYTAEPFAVHAMLVKNKGNIGLEDGMLKLRKGNSYHVTVRGEYVSTDLDNTVQAIEYVEQVSNTRIKVDVDNTVAEPQHFELSYDIFKLGHDTDYQVGFNQDTGIIENLVLEIHSLSNVSVVNGGGGGEQVQADWTEEDPEEPSYIQNKPDIKDLVEGTNIRFREEEDAIYIDAVVTAIPVVTGFATHGEVYESSVTAVQLATAQIPDSEEVEFEEINLDDYALASAIPVVTGYATHNEVYETGVTAVQLATAQIPELPDTEEVQFEEINLGDYALASAIPDISNLATKSEVYNSDVTAIQFVTGLIPDISDLTSKSEVYNSDVTAIQFVTALIPDIDESDIYNATVTAVQTATAQIPDSEEVQFEEINLADYALASAIPAVTGYATHSEVYNATVTAIDFVTAIIPEAQVQSDWTEEDNTDPAYILNKPTEKLLLEGDNIRIRETNEGVYIDALVTAIPSVTGFATETEVYNATVTAVQLATSLIPEEQVQSDWNVTTIDSPAYIKNKPEILETLPIKAGDNISIEIDNDELVIAVTGVAPATGIPQQVQSDWAATGVNDPDYIKNKPDITPLIEGSNIHFTETADGIMISASMPPASGTVTDVEVYNATVTAVQLATAQIPDVSDFVTEDQVTALLPDTEDVQFEEIDLSDYALASAIPDVTNLASKSEVYNATVTAINAVTANIGEDKLFIAVPNTTNKSELDAAVAAGKAILCKVTTSTYGTSLLPMTRSGDDYVFMADTMNMGSYGSEAGRKTIFAKYLNGLGWTSGITDSCVTKGELNSAIAGNTYSAGDGIEINSNVISVDDTKYISYEATGVMLANSNFEIDSNGRAYILSSQSSVINPVDYQYGVAFFGTGVTFPAGRYVLTVPLGITSFKFRISSANIYISGRANNGTATFVLDNTATSSGSMDASISGGSDRLESGVSLTHQAIVRSQEYITSAELQSVSAAIPDVSDFTTETDVYNATVTGIQAATGWTDAQNYLTSVPNTYATKTYVDSSVSGLQTKLTGINDVQVVASLPASPTSSTLYLIPEV